MKHSVGKERGRKKTNVVRTKAIFYQEEEEWKDAEERSIERRRQKRETERKGRERDR